MSTAEIIKRRRRVMTIKEAPKTGNGNGEGSSIKKEVELFEAETLDLANPNDIPQMQQILEMVTDSKNMEHLAGISKSTGISDIINHYKKDRKTRDGRVMLVGGKVVGVFEICPMDFSRLSLTPDEDPSWQIRSAILNRLCIPGDEQKKGRGTRAVAHAENVAFEDHDYSTLIAGIILDSDQKKAYDKAYKSGNIASFKSEFENSDARGKLFLRNRHWKISGVLEDQGGFKEGKYSDVLLVQKTRAGWEKEQKAIQRKSAAKAS